MGKERARVLTGSHEELHTLVGQDTLAHGEALLVVTACVGIKENA